MQIRDLYWTFRNFQQRVRDFLRYRRLTANMDSRFPTATEADVERADRTCIICREELSVAQRPKRLPACGHVFHLHCLRSWLERQQACPICRAPVVDPVANVWPDQEARYAQIREALARRREAMARGENPLPNANLGGQVHDGGDGAAARAQPPNVVPPVEHRNAPANGNAHAPPIRSGSTTTVQGTIAAHQRASAATSFILAASLAPEGQGLADPHQQALEELRQAPGMPTALRAAARGLHAALGLQTRAIEHLLDQLGPETEEDENVVGDEASSSQRTVPHEEGLVSDPSPPQPRTEDDERPSEEQRCGLSRAASQPTTTAATPVQEPRVNDDPDDMSEAAQLRRRRLARFAALEPR